MPNRPAALARPFCALTGGEHPLYSYAGYLDCIERTGIARLCRRFCDQPDTGLLLRHDVDLCLDAALRLARLEHAAGVTATYFILATGYSYNALSHKGRQALHELAGMGFELGLHFDPTIYPGARQEELTRAAAQEARLLSEAAGVPVRSVSLHNPSLLGEWPSLNGLINAYSPRFFAQGRYLSDSCRRLRREDLLAFAQQAEAGLVQLLLHPMHYSQDGAGYLEAMRAHFREQMAYADATFRVNATYLAELGPQPLAAALLREPE